MSPIPSPANSGPLIPPMSRRRRRTTVPDDQRKRVRVACDATKLNCIFVRAETAKRPSPRPHTREAFLEALLRQHGIDPDAVEDGRQHDRSRYGGHDRHNGLLDQQDGASSGGSGVKDPDLHVHHVLTQRTHVQDQGRTHFDGPSSAWAFFDNVRKTIDGDKSAPSPKGTTTVFRHSISSPLDSSLNHLRTSLVAALPPQDVLEFLSTTFFKYCQSNYFFTHPSIFNRKLNAFLRGTHDFAPDKDHHSAHRSIEFIGLLFMILALGSQYADLEQGESRPSLPASAFLSKPPTLDFADFTAPNPVINPGWQFYQVSKRLLSEIASSSSMTSIQVCVLQGSFLVTTSAHDVAYNLYGLALRMAVNMGLHRAASREDSDHLHPHVRELRNRLWWSVYTHERFFTFHMGRPLMIAEGEIDTPLPADNNELRVTPESTVNGQIALIKLCKVMGSIVKAFYSSERSSGNRQTIDIEYYVELRAALDRWEAELPENLQMSSQISRSTFHLHLTHKQGILLLSRITLSHVVASRDPSLSGDHQERIVKFLHDAARDCVSAALETIRILKTLKDRRLLCRFSYQDPLYCSAALHVLLLGAKLDPPTEEHKKVIIEGILILRELADGSVNAASSLPTIIQGFEPFFEKKPFSPATNVDPRDTRAVGHRAWQNWIQGSSTDVLAEQTPDMSLEAVPSSPDSPNASIRDHHMQVPDQISSQIDMTSPSSLHRSHNVQTPISQMSDPQASVFWQFQEPNERDPPGYTEMDQPFWLPGLDETFGAFGHEYAQNLTTNELNLWEFPTADATLGDPTAESTLDGA